MKAQLSFDFYFSIVVFIIFVSSLFFKLITFLPLYSEEITSQRLRSEAFQLSEILVNNVGYPGNWYADAANVKLMGLSEETKNKTNLVSLSKITALKNLCQSDFNKVLKIMDVSDGFSVLLANRSVDPPQELLGCLPADVTGRGRTEVKRIVAFGSDFGELTVQVWKK